MRLSFFGLGLCALLCACTHVDPLAEREFVSQSCVPAEVGPTPAGLQTRETLAAIPEGPKRYVAITADWARRVARMTVTEPVVTVACR